MPRGLTGKFNWGRVHREDHARHLRARLPRFALSIDNPAFYATKLHTVCLCPDRRRRHPPRSLCPALPPWMTRP